MQTKTVAVFCGADDKIPEAYKQQTIQLGAALAKNGYVLINGGNSTGLMNAITAGHTSVAPELARFAVVPQFLRGLAELHPGIAAENIIWTEDVYSRVKAFYDLCNSIIVLPGGYGTMHELMDCLVLSQFGVIKKRILLFNIDNFWDGILSQFKTMVAMQTLQQKHFDHLIVVHSIPEILTQLAATDELTLQQGFADDHWKAIN